MYLKLFDGTVAEYLNYWLDVYCTEQLARNTYNGYKTNVDLHVVPYIGEIPIQDLEPFHLQKLYKDLKKEGLCGTSVLYVHATLRKAFNCGKKYGMLENNICDYIDAPRKSKFKAEVLNMFDVKKLLNYAKETDIYVAVLLAVSLGFRRGEVLGLRWCDVDFKNKVIEVNNTATFYKQEFVLSEPKTKSSCRTVVMNDMVYSALKDEYIRQRNLLNPLNLVLFGEKQISAAMLNHKFKQLLETAKLPDIRFHDLRHTNATLLLKQNVPAKIVSNILGHSSIGITLDTYSHVITEMQDVAVNAINNILK